MFFVDQLASMYDTLSSPRGIAWDGLIANGHGITENGYDPAYMDTMLQDSTNFFTVMGGLSQDFRTKYSTIEGTDARYAMTQLLALVNQTGADVWDAAKQGNWGATFQFPQSLAIDALATLAATAANGAYLHFDGVIEQAMRSGKITADDAMAHADSVVKVFRTFVDLNKNGHLDQFKTPAAPAAAPPATSGLGGPELPAAAIYALAALGVVLVMGLCYMFYVWQVGAPITDAVIAYCNKITASGGDASACVQSLQSMAQNGNSSLLNFMGGILQPIATVAAIGLAIWIGSMILPGVLARRATA